MYALYPSMPLGLLQLRHWRGVPLEQVAADGDTTVGEVLGELAALATLHVRIYR